MPTPQFRTLARMVAVLVLLWGDEAYPALSSSATLTLRYVVPPPPCRVVAATSVNAPHGVMATSQGDCRGVQSLETLRQEASPTRQNTHEGGAHAIYVVVRSQ